MAEVKSVVNTCIEEKVGNDNALVRKLDAFEKSVGSNDKIEDHESVVIEKLTAIENSIAHKSNDDNKAHKSNDDNIAHVENNNLPNVPNFANVVSSNNVTYSPTFLNKNISRPEVSGTPNNISEEVVILTLSNEDHNLTDIHETVTKVLDDIPVSFVRVNDVTNKLTVGFPNKNIQELGENKLKNAEHLQFDGITVSQPKKMLPKLTITNIPTDIFIGIDISDKDKREDVKNVLKEHILKKNASTQELVRLNHTFEVVYINANKNERFCTSAIKVSPTIRKKIIFENEGYLYIGNSKCQVSDRYFYKQCYHCQQIGHISKDCPSHNEKPICMYCSESHSTRFCRKKHQRYEHRCVNCAKSRNKDIFSKCTSHNSGSSNCPLSLKEVERLKKNTEMISKNVM